MIYPSLIRNTLRESWAYKINFLFSFLVEIIPIIGFVFLVKYIYANSGYIGEYSESKAVTYYLLIRLLSDLFTPVSWYDITQDIRDGSLNYHFTKPYSYFWYNFTVFYSLKILYGIIALIATVSISMIVFDDIYIPQSCISIILFITSLLFSVCLSFQITYLISISSFYLIENSAVSNIFFLFLPFITGVYIPLNTLPEVVYKIIEYLPFTYLIYLPASVYLEVYSVSKICHYFMIEFIWILILFFVIMFIWKRGIKNYQANG